MPRFLRACDPSVSTWQAEEQLRGQTHSRVLGQSSRRPPPPPAAATAQAADETVAVHRAPAPLHSSSWCTGVDRHLRHPGSRHGVRGQRPPGRRCGTSRPARTSECAIAARRDFHLERRRGPVCRRPRTAGRDGVAATRPTPCRDAHRFTLGQPLVAISVPAAFHADPVQCRVVAANGLIVQVTLTAATCRAGSER
jgi:hypothetical protein